MAWHVPALLGQMPEAPDFYFDSAPGLRRLTGQIYHGKGGHRGTYFRDPDGHLMEVLTPAG